MEAVQCARQAIAEARELRTDTELQAGVAAALGSLESACGELCAAVEHLEPRVAQLERDVRNISRHEALS